MQRIYFHLAYLLTKHECVIIPGVGAFVVSPMLERKTNQWGILFPPANFLGFNSEVRHNDGLLATSLAKEKNSSYKESDRLIRRFADDLIERLNKGEIVQMQWLGSLSLSDENKIVFKPTANLSCNAANYGFTNFCLPYVNELYKSVNQEEHFPNAKKDVIWIPLNRRILTYAGSIAATVLALFVFSTPLNNHSDYKQTRSASIFDFPLAIESVPTEIESNTNVIVPVNGVVSEAIIEKEEVKLPSKKRYFIIIASLPDRQSAQQTLEKIQSEGLQNASILESGKKQRIYIDQFEDKKEAESFLAKFRKENPKYADAWLFGEKLLSR
jgi:nucleoid DNA-binding protein